MMKKYIILVFLFLCSLGLMAQESTLSGTGIKLSGLNSLSAPGGKIGIERPYKIVQLHKKENTKTIFNEKYLTYNLGMYHHKNVHTNYFLSAEWQLRRQKAKGMFYEFSPGIGVSRTFLASATYTVDDNGNVEKVPLAGNWYAMTNLAIGVGYDFSQRKDIPLKVYGKLQVMTLFPYNYTFYFRPSFEYGIIYCPKNWWKSNYKFKEKSKK